MNKKTLRIHFVYFYDKNFVLNKLKNEFDVVEDSENPEYVFFSDAFLWSNTDYSKYIEAWYKYRNAITIYVANEALLPDFNLFDYILAFDDIKFDDRYIQIFYNTEYIDETSRIIKYEEAKELLYKKKYFCNFIYSKLGGIDERELLFDKLSEYKFVHALGRHKKNSDIQIEPRDGNWYSSSIEAKKDFKFSIAVENTLYRNAVTEKIYTSMLANTIPIYYGDNNVDKYFNKEAFINCHDYKSLDDVVNRLKEIDNNDELWIEMMMKPFRTESQIKYLKNELDKSNEMFLNIFRQDIKDAKRIPEGLMVDAYSSVLENNVRIAKKSDTLINKIVWWIPVKKMA